MRWLEIVKISCCEDYKIPIMIWQWSMDEQCDGSVNEMSISFVGECMSMRTNDVYQKTLIMVWASCISRHCHIGNV